MVQNNLKRVLSLVMALVMVFSMFPVSGHAEEPEVTEITTESQSIAHEEIDLIPETTAPAVVETTVPAETEENTAPTEAEETSAPTEAEETSAPTEAEETAAPTDAEETTAPADAEDEPTEPTEAAHPQLEGTAGEFQLRMLELMDIYLGEDWTVEEIPALVEAMDEEALGNAYWEILILDEDLYWAQKDGLLIQADLEALYEACPDFSVFSDEVLPRAEAVLPPVSFFTTVTVLDGQVSITDSANSNSVSGGTVTIKASGSLFSKKTNNITITNETGNTAELSFDYTTDKASSFKIAGATAAASGSYTVLLEAGDTLSITLVSNSGLSNTTATLKLSNISLTVAQTSSNVTFEFDSTYGSVTVDGTAIATGDVKEISLTDGAELEAKAKNGGSFLGWVDEGGAILSTEASYTLTPSNDRTVKAVFGGPSKPCFYVGSAAQKSVSSGFLGLGKLYFHVVGESYLFDDLTEAAEKAASDNNSKVVVLANSGTLPAGTYTIPSGVTLLIPFDTANTMYTEEIQNVPDIASYVPPTAYRTLTMADGANLVINGTMSISGKQQCAQGSKANGGSPTGPVGFVDMDTGSTITVNSGGILYAYGFITGSGNVAANSGATVYEMFQFMDFRGGTITTEMKDGNDGKKVFPFSQYYVQNIEVPLTIHSGATEYAVTTIYMSKTDFMVPVKFIGKDGVFNLTSGYAVKKYDGSRDRLIVDIHGDVSLGAVTLDLDGTKINSKNFRFPLNGNITVNIKSGTTIIMQDIDVLPGMEANVSKGAKLDVSQGAGFYLYNWNEWGTYCGARNEKFSPIGYAPGKVYTRTEADLATVNICVAGEVIINSNAGIFETASGVNIIGAEGGKITYNAADFDGATAYQFIQGSEMSTSKWVEIPVTSAKLKNADGTYVTTGTGVGGTYTYTNDSWDKECTHAYTEVVTKAATCTEDGVKTFTCKDKVNCGHSYTEVIPAKGHTEVVDTAVAATCTTSGKTEGKHCSVCGTVTVAQEVVNALGHTEVTDAAVAASCTTTGLTEGKHCSVCNTVLVAQKDVDALGHSWGTYTSNGDATCMKDGTKTATCQRTGCGEKNKVTDTGSKKAHVGAEEWTYDAEGHWHACTTTEGCTEKVDYAVHSGGTATCTDQATCSECGVKYGDKKPHSYTTKASGTQKTAATCTVAAVYYVQCDNCEEISKTDTVSVGTADGEHTWSTTVQYSWAQDGKSCTATRVCTSDSTHNVTIDGTVNGTPKNPATCTANGTTTYTAEFTKDGGWAETQTTTRDDIPALGHTWGETTYAWSEDNTTCTATRQCSNKTCEEKATATIASATKAPTCTEKGTITYTATFATKYADWTETQTKTVENAAALDHAWTVEYQWSTDGKSCTATHVCGNDAKHNETETVTASGNVTKQPTCIAAGTTTYTANFAADWATDGQTTTRDDVAAKGHTEVDIPAVEATCTTVGYTAGVKCSVCQDVLTEPEEVPMKDHNLVEREPEVPATCTIPGKTAVLGCTNCTHTEGGEKIPNQGHTEVDIPAVEATCTSVGYTAGTKCSACGGTLVAPTETSMLDHSLVEKEAAVEVTCTTPGKTAVMGCANCSYTEGGVDIPNQGHTVVEIPAVEATCTSVGYTAGTKCETCGTIITAPTETPATGKHTYVDGKCKDCGAVEYIGTIVDTGRTLSFEGIVFIKQYIKVEGFEGVDITKNGGLLIWENAVTEETALFGTQNICQAGMKVLGSEYYQESPGIPAAEYADILYLRVYIKDDNGNYHYGPLKEYSVQQYCENQINKATAKQTLKNICIAMLHYGAAAQIRFNHNVNNLANANIVNTHPMDEWDSGLINELVPANTKIVGTGKVKDNGKALSLEGAVVVNYYFKLDTSVGTPVKAELLLWQGVSGELTLDNVSNRKELSYVYTTEEYTGSSDMIAAAELGWTVYACARFVDSNGNEHYSDVITYSPEYYAQNQIAKNKVAMIPLVKAMVLYGECARIHFGK